MESSALVAAFRQGEEAVIFARYTGTDKRFTSGKVYVAEPDMESSDAVNFSHIELTDDAGKKVCITPYAEWTGIKQKYDFEFLEEVYAVVVKPLFDTYSVGDVVVVDDAVIQPLHSSFCVKELGYCTADHLVLLDRTNVFPGLMLLDKSTGVWVKVCSVDECLWVAINDGVVSHSPEEFRFAVDGDGDIMIEPLVVCCDPVGVELGMGTVYRVIREELNSLVTSRFLVVVNDFGVEKAYASNRFKP